MSRFFNVFNLFSSVDQIGSCQCYNDGYRRESYTDTIRSNPIDPIQLKCSNQRKMHLTTGNVLRRISRITSDFSRIDAIYTYTVGSDLIRLGRIDRVGIGLQTSLFACIQRLVGLHERGSAVVRQSLASVLSPSCARPVDDG